VKVAGGEVWGQGCDTGFEISRKMICIKDCPMGFEKYEEYCVKPQKAIRYEPFLWEEKDQEYVELGDGN
jgi:hypothetical protein